MKNNLKVIIAFIIGLIISGATVYAINASEIDYRDTKLDQALNTLYQRSTNKTYEIWNSGKFSSTTAGTALTKTISVEEGVQKVTIYLVVSSAYNYRNPSISGSIITSQSMQIKSSMIESGKYAGACYEIVANTDGTAGEITLDINIEGATNGNSADAMIIYEK